MGQKVFGLLILIVLSIIPLWGEDELTISGYYTMYFRTYSVSGDRNLYSYDNYGNDSTFDNYTNLYIRGKLYKNAFIDAQLSQDRFSPMGNRLTLEYRGKDINIKIGSILASLVGNEFAVLNKSIDGLLLSLNLGNKTSLSLVASKSRGSTKVESFRGNNTPGPYYLRYSPIVEGSEVVKVDEIVMKRGVDYQLDYYTGELNFLGARIIPEASIITVSYEYFYSEGSSILGFRLGKEGQWGITYLSRPDFTYVAPQKLSREEYFIGTGTPGPFYLSYRPIVQDSETVIVDGVTQTKDAYQINYLSGILTFNSPVPSGSTIVVRYSYMPSATTQGSKQVIGIDGKINLVGLPLVLQMARSTDGVHSGSAVGLVTNKNLRGKFGELSFSYALRSISDDFAPLESVGFFRQEKSQNLAFNWSNLAKTIRANFHLSSGKRPYSYSFSPITPSQLSSFKDLFFNLDLTLPSLPQINFSHYSNSQGGGYNYINTRDELRIFSSKVFKSTSKDSILPPFEEGPFSQNEQKEQATSSTDNNYSTGGYSPASYSGSSYYGSGGLGGYTGYGGGAGYGGYSGYSGFGNYGSFGGYGVFGGYGGPSGYGGFGGYTPYGGYYRGRMPTPIGVFTPGISWSLSLSRQYSSGGFATNYNGNFLMGRFNVDYIPNERLKVSADLSRSKSSTTTSLSNFIQLAYNASDKLSILLSINESNSGTATSSEFYNASFQNSGYNESFSGSLNQKIRTLDIQYLPSSRLSLGIRIEKSLSEGTYTSNSSSDGKSLFFTYLISPRASLSGTYMIQNMDFVTMSGGMKSKLGYLTLSYQPFKSLPFTLNMDYQIMDTENYYGGGASASGATSSNLRVWALRAQNPIGQDRTIFAELRGTNSSGNYPYSRFETSIGVDLRLKRYLTWTLSLNRTNYRGQTSPSGGYTATLFNSAMSLRF